MIAVKVTVGRRRNTMNGAECMVTELRGMESAMNPLLSSCSWEETLTGVHALQEAPRRMNRSLTTFADKFSNPVDEKAVASRSENTSRSIPT